MLFSVSSYFLTSSVVDSQKPVNMMTWLVLAAEVNFSEHRKECRVAKIKAKQQIETIPAQWSKYYFREIKC